MKRLLSTVLLLSFIFACSENSSIADNSSSTGIIAFQNVNVIPMTRETVLEDQTVIIESAKITGKWFMRKELQKLRKTF